MIMFLHTLDTLKTTTVHQSIHSTTETYILNKQLEKRTEIFSLAVFPSSVITHNMPELPRNGIILCSVGHLGHQMSIVI